MIEYIFLDPIIAMLTFVSVAVAVGLIFLFIYFAYFGILFFTHKLSERSLRKAKLEREKSFERAKKLIEDSQTQSLQLLKEANKKAHKILEQANLVNNESHQVFNDGIESITHATYENLRNLSSLFIDEYKKEIQQESRSGIDELHSISSDVKKTLQSEMGKLEDFVASQTLDIRKDMESKMSEAVTKADREVESYIQTKKRIINENIIKITEQILAEILGKVVSVKDQEEYILNTVGDVIENEFKVISVENDHS